MSNKCVACRLLQDYGYVDVEYNLEYECVYQRLKVGALKLRQRQYTIPNLSEECFKRQWTLNGFSFMVLRLSRQLYKCFIVLKKKYQTFDKKSTKCLQ